MSTCLLASLALPLWVVAAQPPPPYLVGNAFSSMWPVGVSVDPRLSFEPAGSGSGSAASEASSMRSFLPGPSAPALRSALPRPAQHLVPPLPEPAGPPGRSAPGFGGASLSGTPAPRSRPAQTSRLRPSTSPRPARTSTSPRPARVSATPATAAVAVRAARGPQPREKLIFAEEFDELDPAVWSHLVTAWRGGNREFQYYRNDRRNSYARDGVLYLKPTLTAREFGDAFLYTGSLYYPDCNYEPCVSYRYGRLEVRAKLPRGDWIWPAIWLKPATNAYGSWPASGEMDLVESRGNANLRQASGEPQGVQKVGATLHFGPNSSYNIWRLTHWEKILEQGDFADDFHVFGLEWSPDGFRFTVDQEEIGSMAPPQGGFWDLGGFDVDPGGNNLWANGTDLAPFDKKFYIILNVAVGGTFFPNGFVNSPFPRPWNWTSGHPLREFWEHRHWWLPSWKGEHAAMQVDYVRVYQTVT